MHTDPSNLDQLRIWDGDEGAYWSDNAECFDRAVGSYHEPFMDAAAIERDEDVLDIGCGTGQTTRDAAVLAVAGSALGVDLSARMIEVARRLAADQGIANARFEQADAQAHAFAPATFDVAISRTGAMFFGDPVAAFTNIAGALRRRGRLALLAWQDLRHNEWIREFSAAMSGGRDLPAPPPGAPGPFALADPGRVVGILGAAGLVDIGLDEIAAPMWFGDNAAEAYRLVVGLTGWMLEGLDAGGRARALDDLRRSLAAHEGADGVRYGSGAWIIRARRP
jgi:SAM-dependent methyltransferase